MPRSALLSDDTALGCKPSHRELTRRFSPAGFLFVPLQLPACPMHGTGQEQ
jgi:hypothetical protein